MKMPKTTNRRGFLKTAAIGATGVAFSSSAISSALNLNKNAIAWRSGLNINPSISNSKVVSCYDEAMVINPIAGDFARQNEGVNTSLIEKNMDKIAVQLTLRTPASIAWSTIFQLPTGKQWDQVKVAIKVNCLNIYNMPRVAIVGKICSELMILGVLAQNITIYDSLSNASGSGKYSTSAGTPISGLPGGIIVSNTDPITDFGPQVPVGSTTLKCSSAVAQKNADNTISYIPDIIVNCATNKGHDDSFGGFAMLMENHVGTIKLDKPTPQELIDINQSEAIIGQGTTDVPCRQQLCIIDSLWASTSGPTGTNDKYPYRIIMGMLAPVVDYFTARKVRADVMKCTFNTSVVNNWLSAFGYPTPPSDTNWQEITPSTPIGGGNVPVAHNSTTIRVSFPSGGREPVSAAFSAPLRNEPILLQLFDLRGRVIRHIALPSGTGHPVTWNGSGGYSDKLLTAGTYSLKCTMGNWTKAVLLTFQN
jgi:hypothetical protein